MKRTIVFLMMIGLAVSLDAQSLVQMARVERARRESLIDQRGPIITNADLLRVKLRPAVEIVVPEEELTGLDEGLGEGDELAAEEEAAATEPEGASTAAGEAEVEPVPVEAEADTAEAGPTPQERLRTTEELIDLLQTKIAALNQDYSTQTNMVPNYVIEQQLTETLQKLQAAQADAVRIRQEISRKSREKRNPA